jgi:hypothetical protein
MYYIDDENINVTGDGVEDIKAADGNTYKAVKEGTVTVSAKDGYTIDEDNSTNLTSNNDGTYLLQVLRGGGINIITSLKKVINDIVSGGGGGSSSEDDSSASSDSGSSSAGATLSGAVGSSVLVINSKADWKKLPSYVNSVLSGATNTTTPVVVTAILKNVDTISSEAISAIAGKNVILSILADSETLVTIDGSKLTTVDISDANLVTGTSTDGNKTINVRSQNLELEKNIVIYKFMGLDKVGKATTLNFVNPDESLIEFRTSPVYENGYAAYITPFVNANYKITVK